MSITHDGLRSGWQDLSSGLQLQLAELLDRYAAALEMGDEAGGERLLAEHPHLQQHLSGHLESLQMLCRATHRVSQQVAPVADRGAHAAAHTATLGDYRIERELGRGGMGIVYEATQLSLRRSVALKVLPFAAVLDQKQVTRFRNEAQAAASLHHPHIVPVYAVGCERGVHYYSMQLIEGRTLEQMLRELVFQDGRPATLRDLGKTQRVAAQQQVADDTTLGYEDLSSDRPPEPPPASSKSNTGQWSQRSTINSLAANATTVASIRNRDFIRSTVELLLGVADALEYAHQQGVIHRDIKPSNLLVDGGGKFWVADFGLARCRGMGNLTAQGNVVGTARYMSPEQVAGRSHEIDHRTDIYSLGITLYELLTLQPAFKAADRELLFKAVEADEPIPPRRLNPAISVDLETIVNKAIAKRKDERYATAGEFADDLRRFLDGRPTLARRPTAVDRAFKWALRRQKTVCAAALIGLVGMLGLALATLLVTRQSLLKDAAHERARLHLNQAHAVVDRFGGLMTQRLDHWPGSEALRAEILREAERYYLDFSRYAADDHQLQSELAKVQFRLGSIYVQLQQPQAAEQKFRAAMATFEAVRRQAADPTATADLALCLHNLAALRKDQGDYTQAVDLYRQAVHLQQPLILAQPTAPRYLHEWATTQTNLGKLLWEASEAPEALQRLEATQQALLAEHQSQPDDRDVQRLLVECRNALVAVVSEHEPQEAERLLRCNLNMLHNLEQPDDAGQAPTSAAESTQYYLAVAQNNLAMLLGRHKQFPEALQLVRESIDNLQQLLDRGLQPAEYLQQLAVAHNNLGQLLWSQEPDPRASHSFSTAEEIFRSQIAAEAAPAETLSRLGGVLHNQSTLAHHHGDLDNAVQHLTEAMEFQALAIRKAPLNQRYRSYLELHRELLDRVLRQIQQQAEVAPPAPQVAAIEASHADRQRGNNGGF